MADSASESYLQAGSVGLRHISSSLFSIPGFFAGLGLKAPVDSDSLRSPTSPLDFKLLSNLSNPFGFKSSVSPAESGQEKKFICSDVGLGIINSIVDDLGPTSEPVDSKRRKNVVFGPQVKTKFSEASNHFVKSFGSSLKSNSLPRNYTISSHSKPKIPNSNSECTNSLSGNGDSSPLESEPFESNASFLSNSDSLSSSMVDSAQNSEPSGEIFPLESKTIFPVITGSPQRENALPIKCCSLPIAIGSGHAYVGSLTAREIELSEDYTCIISHGPNPKTTRIFGDYILESHTDEIIDSREKEELGIDSSLLGSCLEESNHHARDADSNLQLCYSCKKVLEGDDIHLYRDSKAFCSTECSSQENFAEDEIEKTSEDEQESSAVSSYHEDLFIMGLPFG